MIRALIIDDVELARDAIRLRLAETRDFEVVGEAGTGAEAATLIRSLIPDLIFLDVQMPDRDGFELLDRLDSSQMPHVIFVTAHDQYALRAFDTDAVHFLLKPIDDDRFQEALARVRREREGRHQLPSTPLIDGRPSPPAYWSRMVVKDGDRLILLKASEVIWVGSAANYVEVHTSSRSFVVRMTIAEVETRLDPINFARISRSAIINIDRIREIRPLWHGDFEVCLKDGIELRMSRRYRDRLLSR